MITIFAVNGNWSSWGPWDKCTAACGQKATRSRYRECDNPLPLYHGHDCAVDGSTNVEKEACEDNPPCPGRNIQQINISNYALGYLLHANNSIHDRQLRIIN